MAPKLETSSDDYEKKAKEFEQSSARMGAVSYLGTETPTVKRLNKVWACLVANMNDLTMDEVLEDVGTSRYVVESSTVNGVPNSIADAWFPHFLKGVEIGDFIQKIVQKAEVNPKVIGWMEEMEKTEQDVEKTRENVGNSLETDPTILLNTNENRPPRVSKPPLPNVFSKKPTEETKLITFDRTVSKDEYVAADIVASGIDITVENGGLIDISRIDGDVTLRLEEGAVARINEIKQIFSKKPITIYCKKRSQVFTGNMSEDDSNLIDFKPI